MHHGPNAGWVLVFLCGTTTISIELKKKKNKQFFAFLQIRSDDEPKSISNILTVQFEKKYSYICYIKI